MTDLDELKALHEKWLIGTCDDAEMAQEAVMETHFPALIERVEKAEAERATLSEAYVNTVLRISELEAALNDVLVSYKRSHLRELRLEDMSARQKDDLFECLPVIVRAREVASRALGGDHE